MQDIKSAQLPSDARVLVLECVQDPGNLGSLIRTAAGLGWNAVWLTHDCCDPFMDKAMRASRGAVLRVGSTATCYTSPMIGAVIVHEADAAALLICYTAYISYCRYLFVSGKKP